MEIQIKWLRVTFGITRIFSQRNILIDSWIFAFNTIDWCVGSGCSDSAEKDTAQFVHATNCWSSWGGYACRRVNAVYLISGARDLKPIISAFSIYQGRGPCSKGSRSHSSINSRNSKTCFPICSSCWAGSIRNATESLNYKNTFI